jgi:hypothetical protein
MAVDLVRKDDGERLSMPNQMWAFLLASAEASGWVPSGTTLTDEETEEERADWDHTDYSSNEGQSVDEEDAEAMADALRSYQGQNKTSGPEESAALQVFLDFVQIDDEGDQYYPGFEIW